MNASHKNLLFQRRCIFQSLKVIDSGLQKVTLFRQHLVQIYLSAWFISWCGKFENVCLFKAATTLKCIKIIMQRFDKWCLLELGQIDWDCKDFFLTNSINASKCLEVNELFDTTICWRLRMLCFNGWSYVLYTLGHQFTLSHNILRNILTWAYFLGMALNKYCRHCQN